MNLSRRAFLAAGALLASSKGVLAHLLTRPVRRGGSISMAPPQVSPANVFPSRVDSRGQGGWVGNGAVALNPYITSPAQTQFSKWLFPITGNTTFDVAFLPSFAPPSGSISMVYLVDGIVKSPVINGPPFPWTLNTSLIPDGAHWISTQVIDNDPSSTGIAAYFLFSGGIDVIIHNSSFNTGSQLVPIHNRTSENARYYPSRNADFVTFPGIGSLPLNTSGANPYPYQFIAPNSSPTIRDPSLWYVEGINEPINNEYETDFMFAKCGFGGGGGVGIVPIWEQDGGLTITGAYRAKLGVPKYNGVRGNNRISPYATFIGDLDGAGWYFVELTGRVGLLHNDGSVTQVAGPYWDRTALPLDPWDLSFSESTVDAQWTVLGTIAAPPHDFGDFNGANDICQDPRDHKVFYVTKTLDHVIIKIDTNFSPPHCALYAGIDDGVGGFADGAAIGTARFNWPYSIIMSDGTGSAGAIGTMYVADKLNNRIRAIDPTGTTVSTVVGFQPGGPYPSDTAVGSAFLANTSTNVYCPDGTVAFASAYIPYPQTIRFFHDGQICVLFNVTNILSRINLAAGNVTKIGSGYYADPPAVTTTADGWAWMDVDYFGTCGPVDDIFIQTVVLSGMRVSRDNSSRVEISGDEEISYQLAEGGPNGANSYPWAVAVSKTEARFLFNAVAGGPVAVMRLRQTGEPYVGDPNYVIWPSPMIDGCYKWNVGTCLCFPWDLRPSLQPMAGHHGGSKLGVTHSFDQLNAMSDSALGAFIQAGMDGVVPRPELTGNDLRDLIYFIRRDSLAGSYPNPTVQPAANDPDTGHYPVISNVHTNRISPTSIQVSWDTSKPTIGLAAAGSPAQQGYLCQYPSFSPLETGYTTTGHSVTISNLPSGVTPMHFVIVVKDMAGNTTNTLDATVA